MAGSGQSYVPSKFGSMEEWLVPSSYQSLLMEATSTAALEGLNKGEQHQQHEVEYSEDSNKVKQGEDSLRELIMGHPQYWELVRAHMNCHKVYQNVGASADLVAEMDEILQKLELPPGKSSIGSNPELDQFMVAYCNVLNACELELRKTFKEAIECCKKLEQQFNNVSNNEFPVSVVENADSESSYYADEYPDEVEAPSSAAGEVVDPLAGDKELKQMLMKKYGAFIKGLTQDYLKKKKKGKLPKESRQKLLEWWSQHQDHPYPSEGQKNNLAETTGLDPKQINNWFINQRKRHWNPATGRGESSQQEGGNKIPT